ncbi:MAG: hypothetical protein FWD48_04075 [Oscillospiraceae bacterium]|nr:hypothetical protein [Oscillospiraceae bacterium]
MKKTKKPCVEDVLVIRIKADDSVMVDYVKDKHIVHKQISAAGIIDALKQSSMTRHIIKSGFLPKGCIAYSQEMETGNRYFVIEYTERKANIAYQETNYNDFPLPRLVYGFKVLSTGKVKSVNVAVVENEGELNEDTQLYRYPFSNVSGFSMCTGSNSLPTYKKVSALKNLPNFILSIPDGDHHYNSQNNLLTLNYRDLLEHLKDKSPEYYYTDVLIKSNKTLKDFI